MTERRGFFTLALGIAALALALWAAGRGRESATPPTVVREADLPMLYPLPTRPVPIGTGGFWIGGWVGPPPALHDAAAWRDHAAAGLDVSMGPLEDRYRRDDNQARLAFLDSLRAADGDSTVPFVFVRDDSLHPDEATRPGWERRVEAVVRAYAGSPSLAGYFLADEPRLADSAGWAPVARLLRRLDPAHPAYVNFLPILLEDAAKPDAALRWRDGVAAVIAAGDLGLFTFDAYPFGRDGERPHFLATLRAAARVSHETARPFGVVLQWTGHGELRAVTAAEARYQAGQALAHGAGGITWFTYWTPNPQEDPWRWHDGAIAYDGRRTARWDTLAAINARVRALAAARGTAAMRTTHLGGDLPPGFEAGAPPNIPWIRSVAGGPATLGSTGVIRRPPDGHPRGPDEVRYVLVNRDRKRTRTFQLTFEGSYVVEPFEAAPDSSGRFLTVPVELGPGDATVIRVREIRVRMTPEASPAPFPRTPSRSDTR